MEAVDVEEEPEEEEEAIGAEAVSDNAFTNNPIIPTHTEILPAEPVLAIPHAIEQQLKRIPSAAEAEKNLEKAPTRRETRAKDNNTFTEVTAPQAPTSDTLPFVSTEINSETFIRPQHNPAMDSYLKKAIQQQEKLTTRKNKPKKSSFFKRVREKITMYLRKLTLKDIRYIDED